MGHSSVVSSHPKSTGILRIDVLSTGPPDLGRHNNILLRALKLNHSNLQYCIYIYTQIIHFDAHAIFMAMHLKSIFPNRLKKNHICSFLENHFNQ